MRSFQVEKPDIHKMSVDELLDDIVEYGIDGAAMEEIRERPEEQIQEERGKLGEEYQKQFEKLDSVMNKFRELREEQSKAASWKERQEIGRKIEEIQWQRVYIWNQIGKTVTKRSSLEKIRREGKI